MQMKTLNVRKVSVWTGFANKFNRNCLTVRAVRLPFVKDFGCIMELKKAFGFTVDSGLLLKSGDQAHRALHETAKPAFGFKTFSAVTHRKAQFHGGLYNGG
jgi:hypothetical protein